MADPFDVYSDSVGISTSDWGSNLYVQVQAILKPLVPLPARSRCTSEPYG